MACRRCAFVSFLFALVLAAPWARAAQLLPGVHGYGLDRGENPAGFTYPGGPTPEIYHVSLLTDTTSNAAAPAGSLRAALTKRVTALDSGGNTVVKPRIVVFDVGGVITLKNNLTIADGNLTVAGQTAPGLGISLHGATLQVTASNVLVQHLRVHTGDKWRPNPENKSRDAIAVSNANALVRNVVFDHCTFAWSLDEIASAWYAYENMTFNRCIFAEPLGMSIHLDEKQLPNDEPIDVPAPTGGVGSTVFPVAPVIDEEAVNDRYRILNFTGPNQVAKFQVGMVADPGTTRKALHFVVSGRTGPNRGKFRVTVRTGSETGTIVQEDEFDQYAPSGQERWVSYILEKDDIPGFDISDAATTLYVSITSNGTSGSSHEVAVDVFSLAQRHSMGPLFSAGYRPANPSTGYAGIAGEGRLSMHGCIIAHVQERGPWANSKQFQIANTVMYDRWKKFLMFGHDSWDDTIHAAVIGNTFIEGASWSGTYGAIRREEQFDGALTWWEKDNYHSEGATGFFDANLPTQASSNPIALTNGMAGFTPLPQAVAYEHTLYFAGARPRDRTTFELGLISDISAWSANPPATRGGKIKNEVLPGDWPTIPSSSPGAWAEPANPHTDPDGDGYTIIEDRLTQLAAEVEGWLTPTGARQAEGAALSSGFTIAKNYAGYHGTGFLDFPTGSTGSPGTATFTNLNGLGGGSKVLRIRYALASGSRQGQVVVNNGTPQNVTFNSTTAWDKWTTMDVPVTLNNNSTNSIVLRSIGNDLASIDEITVVANLVTDNFSDNLADGWMPALGTWSASSGVYHQTDGTTVGVTPYSLLANNADDVSLSADVKPVDFVLASSWVGLVARFTDPSNYYYAKLTGTSAEIKKIVRGVYTTIGTPATVALAEGTTHRVRFEIVRDQLRLFLNDALVASGTDSALAVGKAGVMTYRTTADFDNVRLDPTPGSIADDFQDGNYTGWNVTGTAQWGIASDGTTVLRQGDTGTSVTARATQGGSFTDQVVRARIRPVSFGTPVNSRWFGLMARYSSDTNYYYLKIAEGGAVELKKIVNGSIVAITGGTTTSPVAIAIGTWYDVKLEVIGSTLRAFINNQQVLSVTDTQFASGSSGGGVMTYGTSASFDDIVIAQP